MQTVEANNGFEKYLIDHAFYEGIPISGGFELLPLCNMNCRMCYIRMTNEEMQAQGRMLSGDEWLRIGKEAVDQGLMFILLTGGEPLLHPDFPDIYKGLRKMGLCVTINTNGTLIDEKIIDLFKSDMPRRVNVSLYGASNETYASLCRNPHGFDQTIHAVRMLKDEDIAVKINYTLSNKNYPDMQGILEIADQLEIPVSVPTYMFPPARKGNTEKHIDYFERMNPQEAAKAQVETLQRAFGKDPEHVNRLRAILSEMEENEHTEENPPGGLLCRAGVSSFWVNWKGNMSACGMIDKNMHSLLSESFADAWESIKSETKKIITSSRCFNCRFRSRCEACAATAYLETGDIKNTTPFHCALCEEYERLLKKQVQILSEE